MSEKCTVQMNDGHPCNRPIILSGAIEKKCIFHSSKEETKLDQRDIDFGDKLRQLFKNKDTEIFDLTGFMFPKSGWRIPAEINRKIIFDEAEFIEGISFGYKIFHNEASFKQTTFKSFVDFSGVKFIKRVSFYKTEFYDEAYFNYAEFQDKAEFKEAIFFTKVEFEDNEFPKGIDLRDCTIQNQEIYILKI